MKVVLIAVCLLGLVCAITQAENEQEREKRSSSREVLQMSKLYFILRAHRLTMKVTLIALCLIGLVSAMHVDEEHEREKRSSSGEVFEDDDDDDDDDDDAVIQEFLSTVALKIFVVNTARDGELDKQAGIAIEGTE
ncbi:histone acetyltransferase KAT2A-like, partial [Clarias magur]